MTDLGLSGKSWQDHVLSLCRIECRLRGETFQPIPDKVHGDHGLEGFTTDGEGYQCYADQDSVGTSDRVEKHKRKLRDDLGKLKKHEVFWAQVFVTTKLKKWFLVTPDVPDKELVTFARKHAKKIRSHNLPFIDTSFEAFIVTDAHFQQAKDWRTRNGAAVLDIAPDDVTQKDLASVQSDFINNTGRKLKQVLPNLPADQFTKRRDAHLKRYLEHENIFAKVFNEDAELYDRLKKFCAQQQDNVKFDSDIDDSPPARRLASVKKSLNEQLDRDFKMLGSTTLNAIALGSIASWLGNCSLEFVAEVKSAG